MFGVHLMKNPAGTFSFCGTVPVRLARVLKDGSPIVTDEDAKAIADASNPAWISKCRVWSCPSQALEAAQSLGIRTCEITDCSCIKRPI